MCVSELQANSIPVRPVCWCWFYHDRFPLVAFLLIPISASLRFPNDFNNKFFTWTYELSTICMHSDVFD